MGDGDRAAHDHCDIERFFDLFVGESCLRASFEVVGDAVVAAQDRRRDEPQQFLGRSGKCAVSVGARIERKKTFDPEVLARFQPLLTPGAGFIELFD